MLDVGKLGMFILIFSKLPFLLLPTTNPAVPNRVGKSRFDRIIHFFDQVSPQQHPSLKNCNVHICKNHISTKSANLSLLLMPYRNRLLHTLIINNYLLTDSFISLTVPNGQHPSLMNSYMNECKISSMFPAIFAT